MRGGGAGVVHGDVDDERHDALEPRTARDEERLGNVEFRRQRKLGDLRVGKKGERARDLVREKRLRVAGPVRDLVRPEDDLVGIGVPQAANAALGRRSRERLEVPERQPERRLFLAQDVGTQLVSLRVEGRSHSVPLYPRTAGRAFPGA